MVFILVSLTIRDTEHLFMCLLAVGSVVENPPAKARDAGGAGLILGSGRSLREGNGNPLQYSYLGNLKSHRGTWQARTHGVTKS